MTAITPEQRQAVTQAGETPVELVDPETNQTFVLMKVEVYHKLRDLVDDEDDQRHQRAWLDRAREVRRAWVRENPF